MVPVNALDILCIDQLREEWNQYRRQLIRDAAMGRQHTQSHTHKWVELYSTLLQNIRIEQTKRKKDTQTLTSVIIDKETENHQQTLIFYLSVSTKTTD